ncbi:MAG: hypothetical protein M0025_12135 [Elusimicrobia bacterium]|nr:hypothetical protein [Elusimicrobiota bacterium]
MRRHTSCLLCVFWLLKAAVPAARAQSPYAASGRLGWSYDDVMVRTPEGSRRIAIAGQKYNLNLRGPFGLPGIGEGFATLDYSEGRNLSQVVAGGGAAQKLVGYSIGGSFLPPEAREFVSLGGTFARNSDRTAWGAGPPRNLTDTSYDGNIGLTLPGLPSLQLSCQNLQRRDSAEGAPASQDIITWRERASYAKGPLRWNYFRTRQDTRALGPGVRSSGNDDLSTDLSLDYPALRVRGLRSLALRASFTRQAFDSAGNRRTQQSIGESGYLTTALSRSGRFESYLGYGESFSRIAGEKSLRSSHNLSLVSQSVSSRWNVNNQAKYSAASGPGVSGQSLDENFNAESPRFGKYFVYYLQSAGSVRWGGSGGGTAGESALQKLSFYPRPELDVYCQQSYSGSGARLGRAREDSLGWAAGVNWRPGSLLETAADYSRQRGRGLLTDQLTLSYKAFPLDSMTIGCGYSLQRTRTYRPLPMESVYGTFKADLGYRPAEGLSLDASLLRQRFAGENPGRPGAMDYSLSALYQLGAVEMSVKYENRAISTVNEYSRLAAEFSRNF